MIECEIVGNFYRDLVEQKVLFNLKPGTELILEKEPNNKYDKNAIKVIFIDDTCCEECELILNVFDCNECDKIYEYHLGYISKNQNEKLKDIDFIKSTITYQGNNKINIS